MTYSISEKCKFEDLKFIIHFQGRKYCSSLLQTRVWELQGADKLKTELSKSRFGLCMQGKVNFN